MPKGIKGFQKGHKNLPGWGFQKGHPPTKGCFKKGHISLHKGKKFPQWGGENHPRWKDGKFRDKSGYIYILRPKHPFCNCRGYIMEHRLMVEAQIGRYLLPTEICHHINGIKTDNCPQNLMVFVNHSAHVRFEKSGNVKPSEIIFDGRKL